MNIKDYLPYYIGCQVLVDGKEWGQLIGFSKHEDCEQYLWDVAIAELPEGMPYNDDFSEDCRIKPVLRKLEDMTDQEAFDLCEFEYPVEPIRFIRANKGVIVEFRRKHPDPELNNSDGYSYSGKSVDWSINQWSPFQLHYLLSRGFDLFGLIPAGLAIDAITLNTPSNGE